MAIDAGFNCSFFSLKRMPNLSRVPFITALTKKVGQWPLGMNHEEPTWKKVKCFTRLPNPISALVSPDPVTEHTCSRYLAAGKAENQTRW